MILYWLSWYILSCHDNLQHYVLIAIREIKRIWDTLATTNNFRRWIIMKDFRCERKFNFRGREAHKIHLTHSDTHSAFCLTLGWSSVVFAFCLLIQGVQWNCLHLSLKVICASHVGQIFKWSIYLFFVDKNRCKKWYYT